MAFALYSVAVVPWVEGKSRKASTAAAFANLVTGPSSTDRYIRELTNLGFPPNSWELDKPTVLRTPQATILLKDFQKRGDSSLHIKPCTLVFYGAGRDAENAERGPTILQARDGAILSFDKPISLQKLSFDGKISGGKLVGDIRILSAGGKNSEDLVLVTSNVEIKDKLIFTRDRVTMRLGKNYASGYDLKLTLSEDKEDETSNSLAPSSMAASDASLRETKGDEKPKDSDAKMDWIEELSHVSLGRLEVLQIPVDDAMFASLTAGTSPRASMGDSSANRLTQPNAPAGLKQLSMLEVRCAGPLHFDLKQMVATLEKNVVITRQSNNKPNDTLRADQLSMHFVRTPASQASATSLSSGEQQQRAFFRGAKGDYEAAASTFAPEGQQSPAIDLNGLTLDRLVAFGSPLVLDARSESAYVETKYLDYDFDAKQIKLLSYNPSATRQNEPSKPVIVRNASHHFESHAIEVTQGSDISQTRVIAHGAGRYAGQIDASADGSTEQVFASWSNGLALQPESHPQSEGRRQLLKVQGDATVRAPSFGELLSDNVDLLLQYVQIGTKIDGSPVLEPAPLRMQSYSENGRPTTIRSPQVNGTLSSVAVNFVEPTNNPGIQIPGLSAPRANAPSTTQGGLPARIEAPVGRYQRNPQPEQSESPPPSYTISGGNVTAWVEPSTRSVQRLLVTGQTRLKQDATSAVAGTKPNDPVNIEGTLIDLQVDPFGRPLVQMKGSPAIIKSADMHVIGTEVQLRGDENRLYIPGPGEITMTYQADALSSLVAGANGAASQQPARGAIDNFANYQDRLINPPQPPKPIKIGWTKHLVFDGQTAQLTGEVTALGDDLAMRTEDLEVVLKQRIDFAQMAELLSSRQELDVAPELAKLTAKSTVFAGHRQRDALGNVESYQQLVTQNLTLDAETGDLQATGPGWVTLTTTPDKLPSAIGDLQPNKRSQSRTASAKSSDRPSRKRDGLRQLSLNFEKQLQANMHRRQLGMYDNIQGWFGPVARWEDRVDPSQVNQLGEEEFTLACNQLSVFESPTAPRLDPLDPKSRKPFELIADHGAFVAAQLYSARGNQITFDEHKGIFTMRGLPGQPAKFWQRNSPTERSKLDGKARIIQYNVKTGVAQATMSDVEIDLPNSTRK